MVTIKEWLKQREERRQLEKAMKPSVQEIEQAKTRGVREAIEEFEAEQRVKQPKTKTHLKSHRISSNRYRRIKTKKRPSFEQGRRFLTTTLLGPQTQGRIKPQRRVSPARPRRQVPQMPSQMQALVENDPYIQRMKQQMAMDDYRRMMSSPMLKNEIQRRRLELQDEMRKRYSLIRAHKQQDRRAAFNVLDVDGDNILKTKLDIMRERPDSIHILRPSGRPTILQAENIWARRDLRR